MRITNKGQARWKVFVREENDAYTGSEILVGSNCVEPSSMRQGNVRGCI